MQRAGSPQRQADFFTSRSNSFRRAAASASSALHTSDWQYKNQTLHLLLLHRKGAHQCSTQSKGCEAYLPARTESVLLSPVLSRLSALAAALASILTLASTRCASASVMRTHACHGETGAQSI
jgi:hypothetical protein